MIAKDFKLLSNEINVKENGVHGIISGILDEFGVKRIGTPVIQTENGRQLECVSRRVFLHYGDDILQIIRDTVSQFSRIYSIQESDCMIINEFDDKMNATGKLTAMRHHLVFRGILKTDDTEYQQAQIPG